MKNDDITLDIIKKYSKNLTTYEILEKFKKIKKVQPMTVYLSLKKLISNDIIHKSNLNKSYILCNHSHIKNQNTFIVICKKCGISEELLANLFPLF
jgi:Fur family zinc uptake transcriptional regulator